MSQFRFSFLRLFHLPIVACGAFFAAGCGSPEPSPAPKQADEQQSLSWEEQLTDIRNGRSTEIRMRFPMTEKQLNDLESGCEPLETLEMELPKVSGKALMPLLALPNLRHLVIRGPIDDTGLEVISKCPALEILNLPSASFTDQGLHSLAVDNSSQKAAIEPVSPIVQFRFASLHVTNQGMTSVASMPKLKRLHLIHVPIDDLGLKHLEGLLQLESFYLDGSNCTDEGLSRLLDSIPGLHLHINELHLDSDASHTNHSH